MEKKIESTQQVTILIKKTYEIPGVPSIADIAEIAYQIAEEQEEKDESIGAWARGEGGLLFQQKK